jgi:hypothetical protein
MLGQYGRAPHPCDRDVHTVFVAALVLASNATDRNVCRTATAANRPPCVRLFFIPGPPRAFGAASILSRSWESALPELCRASLQETVNVRRFHGSRPLVKPAPHALRP